MVTYGRFLLYAGEVLRADACKPLRVWCEQGRVWLTAGAEGIDHQLAGGEGQDCPPGRLLIEGNGVVRVSGGAGCVPQLQFVGPVNAVEA